MIVCVIVCVIVCDCVCVCFSDTPFLLKSLVRASTMPKAHAGLCAIEVFVKIPSITSKQAAMAQKLRSKREATALEEKQQLQ